MHLSDHVCVGAVTAVNPNLGLTSRRMLRLMFLHLSTGGVASGWFCLESTALTLAISATAFSFYRDRTKEKARRMFHASLLYLPVFMTGLLIHRRSDQPLLVENTAESFVDSSSSAETLELEEDEKKIRGRRLYQTQAHPPVAYASVAPFPFLPVPSYDAP